MSEGMIMATDLEQAFATASKEVTELSQAPDAAEKLKLYAMYKQGSAGDCTGSRPGMMDFIGRAKYDAWKELEGKSKDEAMQLYIDYVGELKARDAKK